MSLPSTLRPLCRSCRATSSAVQLPARQIRPSSAFRRAASTSTSTSTSTSAPRRPPRSRTRNVAIGLLGLSLPFSYFFLPSKSKLSPYAYSDQPVTSTTALTEQHKLVVVPVASNAHGLFEKPFRRDGSVVQPTEGNAGGDMGEIVVQHIMIKSPDIQIERPYTPINDPASDGEMRLVVKRVKGGEVGRVVHSLQPGGQVGVRGPIPTFSLVPGQYDKIVMISTGTGIAPFLQLLSKLPAPSSARPGPRMHLIHSQPVGGRVDWVDPSSSSSPATAPLDTAAASGTAAETNFIPSLQNKFGSNLVVSRPPQGPITPELLRSAILSSQSGQSGEAEEQGKILVLVCLPPPLMRPLCGAMTPNLDQGPLTGVLAEMGLTSDQVLKLE